jgi:hypothetical protein
VNARSARAEGFGKGPVRRKPGKRTCARHARWGVCHRHTCRVRNVATHGAVDAAGVAAPNRKPHRQPVPQPHPSPHAATVAAGRVPWAESVTAAESAGRGRGRGRVGCQSRRCEGEFISPKDTHR